MRAGWMRPSAISRSIACLAISRRYGSKPERMIAPGVSSTIRSTPVASSSARMLRPSRPMMRPLRSSLGRSTTETVVSIACSAAQRWMASVMYCFARSAAVSRASASSRLSRFAESCRASPSICLMSSSFASSAVRPATRSSSCCCCGDQLLVLRRGAAAVLFSRSASGAFARRAGPSRAVDCRLPLGERRLAPGERLLEALGLLTVLARLPLGLDRDLVRLFLGVEQRFLLARLGVALGVPDDAQRLFFGAADGFGGDALAVGDPDGEHRGGRRRRSRRQVR